MTSGTDLNKIGEVVSTDLLIIGGGVAGLLAAIKARQSRPAVNVLVVDKATPGYAGQGPVAGGGNGLIPEDRLEEWFKWKVETGGYLNDQEFTYAYGRDSYKVYRETADWGAPFPRDDKGEPIVISRDRYRLQMHWGSSTDMMQFLRGKARAEGARILKRVMVVELLTQGERVAGAVGFSIDSGQFYILKAKATILANGGCMYQYKTHFKTVSGEGVAMAYHVGAEMRNAEFANTTGAGTRLSMGGTHGLMPASIENAKGENLFAKYGVAQEERGLSTYTILIPAMYKEMEAGRGPLYLGRREDRTTTSMQNSTEMREKKERERWGIPLDQKMEVTFVPSVRQGPVRVDLHCRTTVPGLWAVGDTSFGGSSIGGAQSPCDIGGEGLPMAEVTGYWAGLDAADFASEAADPEIDVAEVSRLRKQIYAPLQRKQGLDPRDAIYQIQEAIIPLKYNYFRSEARMQEALSKVEEVKGRLPTLWAKDLHFLLKAHEAACMALCAEMTYRPALMRKESRSSHIREDYPERDDKNWLKWIIIKKEKEEMKLWTEPVPIDKYKLKPPKNKA